MMVHGRADLPLAELARTVEKGSRRPGADAVGLSIDCRGSGWVQPLLNKIVWVTGAGSGIGEAAALTLAKAGGAVVLTGRRREPLETVAHRIRAEGGTAHVEPGDLMDPDAVRRDVAGGALRQGGFIRRPFERGKSCFGAPRERLSRQSGYGVRADGQGATAGRLPA